MPNRIGNRLHKVAADEAGNLCGVGVGLRGLRVESLKIDPGGNLPLEVRFVVAREPVDYGVELLPGATLPFGFGEVMGWTLANGIRKSFAFSMQLLDRKIDRTAAAVEGRLPLRKRPETNGMDGAIPSRPNTLGFALSGCWWT